MRMRFSGFVLMCVPLCASLLVKGFAQDGVIQGDVLDEKGKPIYKALVNVDLADGRARANPIRYVETNETGHFTIGHLDWGKYRLYAMKEDENYPNTGFALYNPVPGPIIELRPDSPTITRSLVFGPKAGKIHIVSVTDTNEPALGQIRLAPEEVFDLIVEMQPLSGLSAEIARIVKRAADANRKVFLKGKMTGPLPPPPEDLQRLQELGDQGISALADYVQPKQDGIAPSQQNAAVLLLARLATDQSFDLIGRFAVDAQDPSVRSGALKALATSQRPKDVLLLQQISKSDPNLGVRAEAAKLLRDTQQK